MGWFYLILAGFLEIGFTTCLKYSQSFTRLLPSILFLVFSIASFFFLTRSLKTIPLGTAYAIWTGIGAFGTGMVGILFFKEPTDLPRLFFLALLILAIIGLKWVSH